MRDPEVLPVEGVDISKRAGGEKVPAVQRAVPVEWCFVRICRCDERGELRSWHAGAVFTDMPRDGTLMAEIVDPGESSPSSGFAHLG